MESGGRRRRCHGEVIVDLPPGEPDPQTGGASTGIPYLGACNTYNVLYEKIGILKDGGKSLSLWSSENPCFQAYLGNPKGAFH